ncbi:hydrolase 1, exosortase A system-associated [Inhella sp.]|uniref:hydrolase 1, exosortase A system-associated n=1 Tax=Inhella sp. TaxID=1921806 RepID=UPI0035B3D3FC
MNSSIEHADLREQLLPLSLQGQRSLGVICEPAGREAEVGVLIVVGGPQYRAGAHRHFVLLARALAQAGYCSLRFDHRGLGDAQAGPLQPFEALDEDLSAALQALRSARPGIRSIVLWGLCDAASAVLLLLAREPHIAVDGLVLLNPWTRSAQSEAATRVKHYYWERLRSPEFWRKLVGGGVGLQALRGWWQARQLARQQPAASSLTFPDLMARAWLQSRQPLLLQLCPTDFTAQEFERTLASRPSWASAWQRPGLTRKDYLDADHTFSQPEALQESMVDLVDWLKRHFP